MPKATSQALDAMLSQGAGLQGAHVAAGFLTLLLICRQAVRGRSSLTAA
ncbi:hypothetical protein [Mesorhizobium loti]|nr:hypothetical protein [Mesorhizobium loti]